MPALQRKRLGEILVEAGVIDAAQLQSALGHQRRWGGRIGQALIDLKMASEEQIASTLATKLGVQRVPLDSLDSSPGLQVALRLVPREFAERNQLLPYSADAHTLWVAMADPTNVGAVDELAFRTGRKVKVALAGDREVARTVRRLYMSERPGALPIPVDEPEEGPAELTGNLEGDAGAAPIPAPASGNEPEIEVGTEDVEPVLFSPRVEVILQELERAGASPGASPDLARLARFSSALVRLLLRKGLVSDAELAAAYVEAERGARQG